MKYINNIYTVFFLTAYLYIIFIGLVSCSTQPNTTIIKGINNKIYLSDKKNNTITINQSKKGKVIFTLDPECPLCKSYTKEINNLFKKYQNEIDFFNVFPSQQYDSKKTNNFIEKNYLNIPTIIDTNHIITNYLDAKVTPECFLLDSNLNILYSGLINDWIKELGRKSQHINNHYLEENIKHFLNKEPITINQTKAIGCIIQKN